MSETEIDRRNYLNFLTPRKLTRKLRVVPEL